MRKTEWGRILATRQGSKVFLSGGLINFKLHRDINITLIVCPQWCLLFLPWAGSKVEKVNKIQCSWFVLLSCWGCRIAKGRRRGLISQCFLWTACGQAEWHLKTWRLGQVLWKCWTFLFPVLALVHWDLPAAWLFHTVHAPQVTLPHRRSIFFPLCVWLPLLPRSIS